MMRAFFLFLLLLGPTLQADELRGRRMELRVEIAELRANLKGEAEALEELRESGWWNLISRRRKEIRLRRLRMLKIRIDHLERELASLKNP